MSQDETTVMDGGKCIYQLRGVRPFLFDVEEYLTNRDKVKLKSSYKINRLNI